MATKNLYQQLNRNANTAAILAIGIAVVLLLGAVVESAPKGYEREIEKTRTVAICELLLKCHGLLKI